MRGKAGSSALQIFVQGTLFVWLASYLNRYWGMPVSEAATLAAGLVLVSGLGQLICGVMTDRISGDSSLKRWNMAIGDCLVLGVLLAIAFRLPQGNLQLALLAPGVFFLASSFGTCSAIIAGATPPAGMPHFENSFASRGAPILSASAIRDTTGRDHLSWSDIERIRQRWRGNLVIKGILHKSDAERAVALGANGIIVSNHGGRKLDGAVEPLAVLPEICEAVAHKTTFMMDSGKAACLLDHDRRPYREMSGVRSMGETSTSA